MNLVVDASVLVGEVLRARGLALLTHPGLTLFQLAHAVSETRHELRRRGALMARGAPSDEATAQQLIENALALLDARVLHVAEGDYAYQEAAARPRIPRDPNDWPLVALALHLGEAPILTLDGDFLGCGLPTWTPDTLRAYLKL